MSLTLADAFGPAGLIMIVLAVMSVVSITLIGIKIAELWGCLDGEDTRAKAVEAAQRGDRAAARQILEAGRAPADRLGLAILRLLGEGRPRAALDAEAERLGEGEMAAMRRRLSLLEVIAMTAPLLGLLGTVLGMIESFQALELAGGAANAAALAGGIWQALLTTAAGLIVAIPAAAAAHLLAARVDRAGRTLEDIAIRLAPPEAAR
ncbi:MAG: MotA/TolQ/ExbB proton channel family protein [Pseudomonadota bacterium]